jgi:hypothetical protein
MAPSYDIFLTFVTIDNVLPSPFDVILTELISQWNPSRSQIVVSSEQLNFLGSGY